jgi:Zn-dependent membrane protease YugP
MFYPMMNDPLYLLVILALMLAVFAQIKMNGTFAKYDKIKAIRNVNTETVSRKLLDNLGLQKVKIEEVPGSLTDHYDPRTKALRLSESVRYSSSIAAIGIAAHEIGHAIQHKEGYSPLHIRNQFVPVANIGSISAFPIFFLGMLMRSESLLKLGILLFAAVVLFHIVTLPVEFNASSKALRLLANTGTLTSSELVGTKNVLNAAAFTYVSATLMAAAQLFRLMALANNRR